MVYINGESEDDKMKRLTDKAWDKVSECKHPEIFAATIISETLQRKCFNDMSRFMDQGLDVEDAAEAADIVMLKELSQMVLLLADCVMHKKDYGSETCISKKAIKLKEEYTTQLTNTLEDLNDDINNTRN